MERKPKIITRTLKIIAFTIGGISLIALLVAVIMWLWNLVVPTITGWNCINYWQALGLAALFRLLTGHFGFPSPRRGRHRHLHEMMRGMSRDERRAFIREKLQKIGDEEISNEK